MIKLFVSDIDGTLTDSTIYVSAEGEELKQFSHRDGRGFHLLKNNTECKAVLMTSELKGINQARGRKLLDLGTLYAFVDGNTKGDKLFKINKLCFELDITIDEVAFIGDDTNDLAALKAVGIAACPSDSVQEVLDIPGIHIMPKKGGNGAVRAFIDYLILEGLV